MNLAEFIKINFTGRYRYPKTFVSLLIFSKLKIKNVKCLFLFLVSGAGAGVGAA